MRRLRIIFIVLVSASGLSVVTLDRWVAVFGSAGAGGALLALMATTAILGAVFFIRKNRNDDHWLLARGFDCDGEGEDA